MHFLLHHCRRSRGLRVLAALACLCLAVASMPVMASGASMPMAATHGQVGACHGDASSMVQEQASACHGAGHDMSCHCPSMSGSMLPCSAVAALHGIAAFSRYASAPVDRVPSPSPASPLRPPSV